jgi:pimeloyl-ACP methyl ester carboxylesterase
MTSTQYRSASINGLNVFYREAGDPSRPTLLLLHGFPTSSFMFRNLIPQLADRYHVIAPDLPGFGFSDMPDRREFNYTFENITRVIDGFTTAIGLSRYAIYVFDYGAPVGLRLALLHPERVTALVTQNGNAYEEGLSDGWAPIRDYWAAPSEEKRELIRGFYSLDAVKFQYLHGTPDPARVAPETYTFDHALLSRPGGHDVQLDLILDYRNNVALYPEFQAYLRSAKPPVLAVWGRNDPFFLPAGAQAFQRDVPSARVRFYDTGHFALETHGNEIAAEIRQFLQEAVSE